MSEHSMLNTLECIQHSIIRVSGLHPGPHASSCQQAAPEVLPLLLPRLERCLQLLHVPLSRQLCREGAGSCRAVANAVDKPSREARQS